MRITLNRELSLNQYIVIALLFFASMNLFAKYFYFIFLAFVVLFILRGARLRVNGTLAILLVFSLIYIIFYSIRDFNLIVALKYFAYPMCYAIGLNLLEKADITNGGILVTERKIATFITLVALGAFFHYLINLIINSGSLHRNNIDIWSGEILNATGQAALGVLAIAVFVTTLLTSRVNWHKIIALLGIILVLWYNLILAGRTLIIITAITLLVGMLYITIDTRTEHKLRKSIVLIILFGVIVMIYMQNEFGLRDIILGSNLSTRMEYIEALDDLRWTRKYQYLVHMLDYPFGGGELHTFVGGYAHGLLLDVYSDAGVFAYIILITVLIISFRNVILILKNKQVEQYFKLLALSIHVVLLLEFMIEPILAGMPWMFCDFCFFSGLLQYFKYKYIK